MPAFLRRRMLTMDPVNDPQTAIWVLIGMVLVLTALAGCLMLRVVWLEFELLREQVHRHFDRVVPHDQ